MRWPRIGLLSILKFHVHLFIYNLHNDAVISLFSLSFLFYKILSLAKKLVFGKTIDPRIAWILNLEKILKQK